MSPSSPRSGVLAALLLALAAPAGCKAPPLPVGTVELSTATGLPEPFALGPSDRLYVTVLGQPELSTPETGLLIDPQGNFHMPLIGSVPLAGLTIPEGVDVIESRLDEYLHDPVVGLNVIEYGSRSFYVFGEVAEPGAYPLSRPLTALQALSFGGGFNASADRVQVAVLRPVGNELGVRFFNAETPGLDGMFQIHSQDFIFVRRTGVGRFRDQIVPVIQGIALPINILGSLVLIADRIEN